MGEQRTASGDTPSVKLWTDQDPPTELRGLILAAVALSGLPALVLVVFDGLTAPGTAGALGVLLLSLALSVWLVRHGLRALSTPVTIVVLLLASASMIGAYVLGQNPVTVLATSVPFGFGVAWIRPRWLPAVVGLGSIATALLVSWAVHGHRVDGREVMTMGIYFGAALIGFAGTSVGWQMQRRMDRFHADQNELSLARERLRFATDLHDIQGHTLLAIKMKAELARRSLDRDPDRVLRELQDIESLAAQAGDQTRELAQGYRALTLAAELANLEQLLSAAGIAVRIERRGAAAAEHEKLFATLVREAASNILRHADATSVRIDLLPTTITVRNDGVTSRQQPHSSGHDSGGHGGSGLIGLGHRFEQAGGSFTWQAEGESFTVTGTLEENT